MRVQRHVDCKATESAARRRHQSIEARRIRWSQLELRGPVAGAHAELPPDHIATAMNSAHAWR
jgi:hypothetical protein